MRTNRIEMIHTSEFWVDHFTINLQKKRINWNQKPAISVKEKEAVLYSLKAWQLGETSDGAHLLEATREYAKKINNKEYLLAMRLFIKEEQKHGINLGRYIDMIGEEQLTRYWGDSIFRFIRGFNTSMQVWTITAIIVESAAQIFYQALHDATDCTLLKEVCRDIMIDEAQHIKFQNERMHVIFQQKSFYNKAFSLGAYSVLFFGTIHAIWFGHKKAFIAGGIDKNEFMRIMYAKFLKSMSFLFKSEYVEAPTLTLAHSKVI